MTRLYVAEVYTDMKIGGKATLGPRTLIVGENRAGKSTLVNAIEAAGSGRVSDVAGRATLARARELFEIYDATPVLRDIDALTSHPKHASR